jgi:D-inositol-3-phosphate glycosyltransferase
MIQRLNIAMISIHSCPLAVLGGRDTGGMNVYVRELARELAKRGHAVDIYTKAHQPEHGPAINLGQNVRIIHLDTGVDEDMPKIAIYDYIQRLASVAEDFRKFNQLQYDLIHSHYWLSGLIGKELQKLWHVPHTVMFHTLGAIKNSLGIGESEPELRIESEKEVISSCDRVIASTPGEKQDLVKLYGASYDKISVIPCGVNPDLFQPIDREQARKELGLDHQKVILFVGRMDPLKGLEQLLTAMTYMDGDRPPMLMIVGGDSQSRSQVQSLHDLTKELDLEKRVRFVGPVAQSRLPLYYSASDVCAIPSHYESFGMVALESLACGTPIVATDVGGLKNIIRNIEAGRILRDNSPHSLASEITELFRGTENEGRIQICRDAIAGLSWTNIADKILGVYYRLLQPTAKASMIISSSN